MISGVSDRPIANISELLDHFRVGSKSTTDLRIGLEHEKVAVLADGSAPDFDRIEPLLSALAARGWNRVVERDRLIALEQKQSGSVTLEPGGQIEHSGAPFPSGVEAARENQAHIDQITPLASELGLTFLGIGFRPFGTLDDVPWMPKGRYRVMRSYLPKHGNMAHEMMKRTATVQANLDYVDEADAMEKLRLGLGLSSLVTALFAASPIVDGKLSGHQSYRAACWLATDPDRCGLLPFAFKPDACFSDYVEWALDVPMFFLYRNGEYRELEGVTFRRFMREGIEGVRALPSDWALHLSTLFPETRLKQYVEVRQADASTRALVSALPVLWRGLFYDADSRHRAWSLVADWTFEERLALYRETPMKGLRARIRNRDLRELSSEMVSAAKEGLLRLGSIEGAKLLAPLEEIASTGRTVADRIIEDFERVKGDRTKLIEAMKLT